MPNSKSETALIVSSIMSSMQADQLTMECETENLLLGINTFKHGEVLPSFPLLVVGLCYRLSVSETAHT